MEVNKIYHDDWMNNQLPDKSVQLIIADPPYYKVKGDFDFVWKTFDDYLQDVEKWAIECKRVLADNGTLYWYGDAKNIAYAQIIFDKHFNLLNSLVWENTNDHKQQIRFNTDLRTFAPLTERCLMYGSKAMDTTGLKEVEMEYVAPRNPFALELKKARLKKGVSINQVAEYLGAQDSGRPDCCVIRAVHKWQLISERYPKNNNPAAVAVILDSGRLLVPHVKAAAIARYLTNRRWLKMAALHSARFRNRHRRCGLH